MGRPSGHGQRAHPEQNSDPSQQKYRRRPKHRGPAVRCRLKSRRFSLVQWFPCICPTNPGILRRFGGARCLYDFRYCGDNAIDLGVRGRSPEREPDGRAVFLAAERRQSRDLVLSDPEVQALPAEAAIPPRSSSMTSAAASVCENVKLAMFGSLRPAEPFIRTSGTLAQRPPPSSRFRSACTRRTAPPRSCSARPSASAKPAAPRTSSVPERRPSS